MSELYRFREQPQPINNAGEAEDRSAEQRWRGSKKGPRRFTPQALLDPPVGYYNTLSLGRCQ